MSCIVYYGGYITYCTYKKRQKMIYRHIDHLLENEEESDDEILMLIRHHKNTFY